MHKSSLAAAILSAAMISQGNKHWFSSSDFKGQTAIPHNPRNNRKTKKGGKR